jgi:cation diffusion facilitator family transporter
MVIDGLGGGNMKNYHNEVKKVLMVVLTLNIIMASIKITFGYYSGILTISADGYDSLLDAVANIIAVTAIYISSRPKSKNHPYGYTKIENFASIIIGFLLLLVSYEIFTQAIDKFLHPQTIEVGYAAFAIMIMTLVMKMIIAHYEKSMGQKHKSDLLIADAGHTRSDVWVTAIVLIGLVLMQFDLTFIDPLISIVIMLIIIKTAIDIFRLNFGVLLDSSRIECDEIIELICDVDNVVDIHNVRTRGTTSDVYVDMHLVVCDDLSIKQAHQTAHICEERILNALDEVTEVLIHIESEDGLHDAVTF